MTPIKHTHMLAKISKIVFELIFLIIAIGIAVLIISLTFGVVNSKYKYDEFTGKVTKKELIITSPSFAIIESLNVYEGELVKKGDQLANLKIITEPNSQSISDTLVSDDTYKISKDKNNVIVYAPSDGIVGSVSYAEKSSVRPELQILTLYPLASSSVLIDDKLQNFNISNYSELSIQKQNDSKDISPIKLLSTYPVDSPKDGGTTLYANFVKNTDSNQFNNGEDVVILATKKDIPNNLISALINGIMSTYNKYRKIIIK
jgi:hypothetical protein